MTELIVIDTGCEDIAGKIASGLSEYGEGFLSCGDILIRSISTLKEMTAGKPDILVLTEDAAKSAQESTVHICCGILLLPGDYAADDSKADTDIFDADCIVTYGMSPKNTITLSSISEESCVLALQRELITTNGNMLERQEIKVKGGLRPGSLLAVAGALLILGQKISDINP
jgi:hypothetical protein